MAENTIDNLSIQVTASAERAVRTFDRLASSAGRLRGAASTAGSGVRDMASGARDAGEATQEAGKQSGNAAKNVRQFGKDAKNAGDNAKKGSSGLKTFWESLKRIAFYRAVRSIIRSITDAFKTGITNMYQWSKTMDGTFAASMDRLATSTLYLKNSLGAMLAPLINTLAPIIDMVVDGLVWIINHVNMLFAALSGSQTYTVAKKVATTWGDAAKDVSGNARKAAEDIKRTLLGFDEINKLEKQDTNSYGGGSANNNNIPNYSDMFEERQLDGWLAGLASLIDKMKLGWAGVLGGILAGWEAIKLAIKAVSELSLGWLKDMAGKTIDIAVSLIRKGWKTITDWALSFGKAVVDLAVRIKTSAAELWKALKKAWGNANKRALSVTFAAVTSLSSLLNTEQDVLLGVKLALATTAAQLKNDIVVAWNRLTNWALNVKLRLETKASDLKNSIVSAWARLVAWSLAVKLRLETTAANLKNDIVVSWNKLVAWSLAVKLRLGTTAAQLKNDIVVAWNKLTAWSLSVKLRLETTAANLKNDIVAAWAKLVAWSLSVQLTISTKASELKQSIIDAWKKLGDWFLEIKISSDAKIKSAVNDVWGWVKSNWETVAVTALGIAIAIATPWSTIATALSALWSDVMASFGGALAFGVFPTFGKIDTKSKLATGTASPSEAKQYVKDNIAQPIQDLLSDEDYEIWVDAHPGTGFKQNGLSRKQAFALDLEKDATVDVGLQKDWLGTPLSELNLEDMTTSVVAGLTKTDKWRNNNEGALGYLKLTGLNTSIKTSLTKVDAWKNNGWENYLKLNDLVVTIKTRLQKEKNNKVTYSFKGGGTGKSVVVGELMKRGGVFVDGAWHGIPQYAGGTLNAGTIFAAGEAGPEVVGHVGGRTEVLNKSQLASAMYSAVQAAMAPAAANFAAAAQSMSNANISMDYEMLADMVRQGVEQAMARTNDLDRQRNEYLRQINDKEFTSEVTTASINKAQTRMNRRAGVTIVPVG